MDDREMTGASARRRRRFDGWTLLVWIAGGAVYLFLVVPVLVIILSAFSPNPYPEFPPTEFSLRWFREVFQSEPWMRAIGFSLWLMVIVTALTVALGTTAAYGISRLEFRGKQALLSFMLSPLMIPQVVMGIALLYLFTAMGIIRTMAGLVIGHILVSFPYVIRTVGVSLSNLDPKLERASMSLGAGPVQTFFRITLPLIRPGIVAGGGFSAVTSFGEGSISLFVVSPSNMTVPVRIFNYIDQTFDPSVNAISVLFIAVAVLALIIIERTIGLTKVM